MSKKEVEEGEMQETERDPQRLYARPQSKKGKRDG